MADAQVLNVEVREETGRHNVRKLRAAGKTPAVIYGHGEGSVSLSVSSEAIERIIFQGDRIVDLKGGQSGQVFIRDVQWNLYGTQVMHVDFTRVEAGELIDTTVTLELRGDAPGTHVGGLVEQVLKEMPIQCPPRSMTDHIEVSINELEMDGKITVGDIELPEGASTGLDPSDLVVQCIDKATIKDTSEFDELTATGPVEPEVIGEKKDDEGSNDS